MTSRGLNLDSAAFLRVLQVLSAKFPKSLNSMAIYTVINLLLTTGCVEPIISLMHWNAAGNLDVPSLSSLWCSMCIEMGCKTDKGGITQNNQGYDQLPDQY